MPANYFRALLLFMMVLASFVQGNAQENHLHFTHLTVDNGLPQNTIHGIIKDKYGFMWFGTWDGLCRFDGYSFRVFRNDPSDSTSIIHNRVHFIVKDSAQDLWIQTYDRTYICKYNYTTENFTRLPVRNVKRWILDSLSRRDNFSRRYVIGSDYLWRTEENSNLLIQKNRHTGEEFIYRADASLSDELITDLYLDDENKLWVGTFNGGINVAEIQPQPFRHFNHDVDNKMSLIDNHIRAICTDKDNNLWVGTRNRGVTMLNFSKHSCTHFKKGKTGSNTLQDENVRKILCDSHGQVWIGTKMGLDWLDTHTGYIKHFSWRGPNFIPSNWVYDILEDSYSNLWIATFNGIARYNHVSETFEAFRADLFSQSAVRVLYEDSHHNLWVGTERDGIYVFQQDTTPHDKGQLMQTLRLQSSGGVGSISSNMIFTIAGDCTGCIWIGTSNGLNRFDPAKKEVKCFSSENSLPDNMVVGALSDPAGYVWVSHSKGLSRINIRTYEVRNFDKKDGLQANEFSEGAYYRNSQTGEMFFGGINGLNTFFPSEIKSNTQYPAIFFTNLYVDNKAVNVGQIVNGMVLLKHSMLETENIQLNYATRNFSIEFAALQFSNPSQTHYKYKLEGFNNDWIKTGSGQRRAYYTNLKPGTYVFKVLAANSDDVWTPQPKTLIVLILPPWYLTRWIIIFYVLIIVAIFYVIYKQIILRENLKNQVRFEKMKADEMQELDRMKVQFFTGVSHEFRTPLSLIVDPLERIVNDDLPAEKVKNYALLMQRNTQRLMNLVNQLLDFRKLEAGQMKLETKPGDLFTFVSRIAEAFEYQAQQHHIRFTVIGMPVLVSFDPDKMEKIVYNLLSNAFKNTLNGGNITIEIKTENKNAEMVVSDSGVGIPADQLGSIFEMFYQAGKNALCNSAGTGIGLALSKQLVELQGGSISVESTEGVGTRFTITLPVFLVEIHENSTSEISYHKEITQEQKDNMCIKPDIADAQNVSRHIVLVVEDNSDVREYICAQLSPIYRVLESPNGRAGLNAACTEIPDLVISDVMMPDMDGFEFCEALKTNELTSHIPVILLTARHSVESKVKGYETGADAYLTKPFSTPMLLARVQNLLITRQKLRVHFLGKKLTDSSIEGMNVTDKAFIDKAVAIVYDHLDDPMFDIDTFAAKLFMSRSQLYRKINALSNQSVNGFINTIRMNKAAEMLLERKHTISEIAYETGFTQPNNFSRSFTKHHGISPSEYVRQKK